MSKRCTDNLLFEELKRVCMENLSSNSLHERDASDVDKPEFVKLSRSAFEMEGSSVKLRPSAYQKDGGEILLKTSELGSLPATYAASVVPSVTDDGRKVFPLSSPPPYTYCIGRDVYAYATVFNGQILVHIRKYHVRGTRCSISKEGVAFKPHELGEIWHETVLRNWTFNMDNGYSDNSCSSGCIKVWRIFLEKMPLISSDVVRLTFKDCDFKSMYEEAKGSPLPYPVSPQVCPIGLDYTNELNVQLKLALAETVHDMNAYQTNYYSDLEMNMPPEIFNDIVIDLNPRDWAKLFYSQISHMHTFDSMWFLSDFITDEFLDNVNILQFIDDLRNEECFSEKF